MFKDFGVEQRFPKSVVHGPQVVHELHSGGPRNKCDYKTEFLRKLIKLYKQVIGKCQDTYGIN
jgi:hypothetical protein